MRRQAGFTLAEMLVVLTVLGLVLALVLPASFRRTEDLGARASQVAALLRLARTEAMFRNEDQWVSVDFASRQIGLGDKRVGLDEAIALSVLTARNEIVREDARIRFLPDGSSTGGAILLEAEGRARRIDVHWLTGAVTVHAPR